MSLKARLWDSLFYLLAGTLYAFALMRGIFHATILEIPATTLLVLSGGFMLFYSLWFFNRYTFLILSGGLAAAGIIVWLSLRAGGYSAPWYLELLDTLWNLVRFFRNQIPQQDSFAIASAVITALVLCLLTALSTQVHLNFMLLSLMGGVVLATPVYMDWKVSQEAFFLLILSLVILLAKKMNLNAVFLGEDLVSPGYSLLIFPMSLCILAVATLLPKPDVSFDGLLEQEEIRNAAEQLAHNLGPVKTGSFSENGGRLGGPIIMGNTPVMEVTSDGPLYLSGSVRDTYTGSSWTQSSPSVQVLEAESKHSYSVSPYSQELSGKQGYFMRYYGWNQKTATINTLDSRTRTFFTPAFSTQLSLSSDIPVRQNSYGNLSTARPLEKSTQYELEYIGWNYSSAYFSAILEQDGSGNGAEMEQYLVLPRSLPERVRELAAELTVQEATDYAKIKALEQYLYRFPYTLTPDSIPPGEDFVDYFLFTGQEGYCVYYASALAVMGRCVGIPTRYVEGYVTPMERNGSGSYTVTSAQAHAWTEIWFPSLGWVQFEPTAPYNPNHQSGLSSTEPLPEPPAVDEVSPSPPAPEETAEPQPSDPAQPPESPAPTPGPSDEEDAVPARKPVSPWVVAAIATFLVLGGMVAAVVALQRRRQRILRESPNRTAVTAMFGGLVAAAGLCGTPIAPGETALSYAARAGGELVFQKHSIPLEELAEIASRASFSSQDISGGERSKMKSALDDILAALRKTWRGRLRYLVGRYLTGVF